MPGAREAGAADVKKTRGSPMTKTEIGYTVSPTIRHYQQCCPVYNRTLALLTAIMLHIGESTRHGSGDNNFDDRGDSRDGFGEANPGITKKTE